MTPAGIVHKNKALPFFCTSSQSPLKSWQSPVTGTQRAVTGVEGAAVIAIPFRHLFPQGLQALI